ncbi:MAG: class I SAM-dependent methyltransferase [Ferruginibacter sp.]
MKKVNSIQQLLGQTDIYLIDQILKGRYVEGDTILDAGCGSGRNLHWFIQNQFNLYGIDSHAEAISKLKNSFPGLPADRFLVSPVEETIFTDNYFDHIISSAVLHFADSTAQFIKMIAEMERILKPAGTIFIRMTSDIGIGHKVKHLGDGVYLIPDGSKRFLLTGSLLAETMERFNLSFIEPLKTVNVDDIRCMSTLVLQKNKKI